MMPSFVRPPVPLIFKVTAGRDFNDAHIVVIVIISCETAPRHKREGGRKEDAAMLGN